MQYLEITIPDEPPRRYPVGPEPVVLGRGDDCDIRIERRDVRTHHAVVRPQLTVEGLEGPGAAVLHHGRQVAREIIEVGDSFDLDAAGTVRVALRDPDADAEPPSMECELARLRAIVRQLENEKAALFQSLSTLEQRIAEDTNDTAPTFDDTADAWLQELLDLPERIADDAGAPPDGAERLRMVLHGLYDFALAAERTTVMHERAGDDGRTAPPSLVERLRAIAASGHSRRSGNELRRFLKALHVRFVRASVATYRRSVEQWITGFLKRLWTMRSRAGPTGRLDPLGLRFAKLVNEFESLLQQITADVALDEIQDIWTNTKEPQNEAVP